MSLLTLVCFENLFYSFCFKEMGRKILGFSEALVQAEDVVREHDVTLRLCSRFSVVMPVSFQVSERLNQPGVAIGLAWTPLGGEIMFVEASRMDGEGQLTLTGQLGDVMKESAHLAISWLRSNAKKYQLTNGMQTCASRECWREPRV